MELLEVCGIVVPLLGIGLDSEEKTKVFNVCGYVRSSGSTPVV
jgi:hypothetical protein